MKTGIIGAGALGSLFAHILHDAGMDIAMHEKSDETVSAIKKNGLTMLTEDKSSVIQPDISSNPDILAGCDVILLLVKSYSTLEAISSVVNFIKPEAVLVSLQNGIGNYDVIKTVIDPVNIVYGTTTFGAYKDNISTVIKGGSGIIKIGGESRKNIDRVFSLFTSAGIDTEKVDDPDRAIWQKAVINAGINPVAAILGLPNGEILTNSSAYILQEYIIKEACEAAPLAGISLDYNEMIAVTRDICEKTSRNNCSMLQDVRAGRRTEIDSINGRIVEYGDRAGRDFSYNRSLCLLIRGMWNKTE